MALACPVEEPSTASEAAIPELEIEPKVPSPIAAEI
jgi:hypothetical protein